MTLRLPLLPREARWGAVLGLAAFIFYASIVAAPPETIIDQARPDLLPLDKWRHLLAYAALGYALAYATTDWAIEPRLAALAVIGTTILYGIGIEVGQSLIPQRYLSVGDAYANAVGGALVLPWYLVRPYLEFTPLASFLPSSTE